MILDIHPDMDACQPGLLGLHLLMQLRLSELHQPLQLLGGQILTKQALDLHQ
jgi:hypothetical protein